MDKTMGDKLVYIPSYNKQNYILCRLKSLVEKFGHCKFQPTNQYLIKVPKVDKLRNKRAYL